MTSDEKVWLDLYKIYKANLLPPRKYTQTQNVGYWPEPFNDEFEMIVYLLDQKFKEPDTIAYFEGLLSNEP